MKKMSVKTNKIIQNVVRVLLLFVISLIIGITVYSFNVKSLKGDQMPMPFKIGISVVLTGSMEPTISVNDLIIVKETNDYEVGDIVVFQDHSSLVVHKIIRIDGEEIVTKGDANDTEDAPISVKQIKGEVVSIIPVLGLIVKFIKSPIGIVLILAGAIVLLRLSYKKEKEEIRPDAHTQACKAGGLLALDRTAGRYAGAGCGTGDPVLPTQKIRP